MLNICESLETFWDISYTANEQNVDMRADWIERNISDVKETEALLSYSSSISTDKQTGLLRSLRLIVHD